MLLRGLYGMVDVPSALDSARAVELAQRLLDGGACALQLRAKSATGAELFALAEALLPLAQQGGVPFIVNDRLDVALLVGADGAHLGQDDLPLVAARRLMPPGFVVGISTHTLAQAEGAVAAGADYIGFGPCYATTSKARPDRVVTLEELRAVCQLGVPVVAIGGISVARAKEIAQAGASAAAAISAVNNAQDVVAAARAIGAAFTSP